MALRCRVQEPQGLTLGLTYMSDRPYQVKTALIHGGLALACLLAAALSAVANLQSWVGLVLSGLTNALIAWEKAELLRRKPDG